MDETRAIVLVGMMGVGKSTAGEKMALALRREHLDTDRMLVRKLGRPIPQLFQMYGEATFRDHETAILKELQPGPLVVSTGGGIVLRPQNWDEMRRLGIVVYLQAPLEVLVQRLSTSRKKRPLLQGVDMASKVAQILEARTPLYLQADVVVELGDATAEQAANLALRALGVKA